MGLPETSKNYQKSKCSEIGMQSLIQVDPKRHACIKRMLHFQALAYCIVDQRTTLEECGAPYFCKGNELTKGANLEYISAPNSQDVHFYIATVKKELNLDYPSEDCIVVVFRGTMSIRNLLDDFNYAPIVPGWENLRSILEKYPEFALEGGFYNCYNHLRHDFMVQITQVQQRYPHLPIYITGHSLGGAIATIAALDIALQITSPKGLLEKSATLGQVFLITAGSPRVGTAPFADFMNDLFQVKDVHKSRAWRVVNHADIVPFVPFPNLSVPEYRHVGLEVWLLHRNIWYGWFNSAWSDSCICPCKSDGDENPSCSYSVPILSHGILDHLLYMDVEFGPASCSNLQPKGIFSTYWNSAQPKWRHNRMSLKS
jgi:hypothetical protein